MARARRKTYSLDTEERAIIRTWGQQEDIPTVATYYATTLDVSSGSLQVYSRTLLPIGEVLHIDVSLQGQHEPHNLKGVARAAHRSDDVEGYVITLELVPDNNALRWRRQFH
jgi:hypothetical protein